APSSPPRPSQSSGKRGRAARIAALALDDGGVPPYPGRASFTRRSAPMRQPEPEKTVGRRRFLKTAAGTTAGAALTAWSLRHPSRARAAAPTGTARAAEASPKRGGVLRWAGPAEVAHFDVHQ